MNAIQLISLSHPILVRLFAQMKKALKDPFLCGVSSQKLELKPDRGALGHRWRATSTFHGPFSSPLSAEPGDEVCQESEEMLEHAEAAQDFAFRAKLAVQKLVQKV